MGGTATEAAPEEELDRIRAALFHPEAIRRLIEIAATAKPKRQTKAGEK
jgi:hypothetical protein